MTNVTALAHGKNDYRFDDLLEEVGNLGKEAGRGKDTLARLHLRIVQASYEGILSMERDKHGVGVDDAAKLYGKYATDMASSVIFDATTASSKAQISKMRASVKLGTWTKGGPGEPINTLNKLMQIRSKLRQDPATAKKLEGTVETILRFARVQVKLTSAIEDEQMLRNMCLKSAPVTKGVEDYLASIVDKLDKLKRGKAAGGTLLDDSAAVVAALGTLNSHLQELRAPEEYTVDIVVDAPEGEQEDEVI